MNPRKIFSVNPVVSFCRFLKTGAWFILMIVTFSFTSEEFRLINSIPFKNVQITTDRFGNAYVYSENQLLQYDSLGRAVANYSDRHSGFLTSVDASNPLKILLFYRDFARIQLLNKQLAVASTIELRNIDIMQPLVVCQSSLDGYWIFDQRDFSLKKIDVNLRVLFQSNDMNQTLGYPLEPLSMIESNDYVFMNNPATGILMFDKYGSYYKTIPVFPVTSFQVIDKDLLYVKNSKLYRYNFSTLSDNEVILPQHDSITSARFEQHELYLLTTTSLDFYSY
jgi:hypothetical protein